MMTVKVPDTAQCHNCRYLLRGLPNPVCPECGQPFDPEDPDSYHDPARPKRSIIGRLIERLRPDGPHSVSDLLWIALLTLAVVFSNSSMWSIFKVQPRIGTFPCCLTLGLPVFYMLLGGVIVDLAWRWRIRARARRTGHDHILANFEKRRRRWRLAIACVIVSCVTIAYPWPAYLRFYASWPSLRREAQALLSGKTKCAAWRRIGLYDVEVVYGVHKGIVFFQVGHDSNVRYGFAYRPNGPPPWNDRYGRNRIHWRWAMPSWYMEAW